MKLRTLIIEDELPAQKVLKNYINDLPHVELVGCFNNALEAIAFLQQQKVDLILLDINLPKLSGLDFLKSTSVRPKVILTTAYPEYALEGFELDVVDYLLKPFSFLRFVKAIDKAIPNSVSLPVSTPLNKTEKKANHFFIKVDKVFYKINLSELLYLKSEKDFIRIYTESKNHLVLQTLKYYESILPTSNFTRVHKSYIINLSKVDMVFGNTVRMADTDIPIGRSYKDSLIEKLNQTI